MAVKTECAFNPKGSFLKDLRGPSPTLSDLRKISQLQQAVGGQPPQYAPAPLLPPRGRWSASCVRADGNVAAVYHGQHVPTPTAAAAWRANTAVSKAARVTLTSDLLTLKVVSESRVTWATSVPILVGVLDLGPMYVMDVRQKHRLMPPPIRGVGMRTDSNSSHGGSDGDSGGIR